MEGRYIRKSDYLYLFRFIVATKNGTNKGILSKSVLSILIAFSSFLTAQDTRSTLAVVDFDARGIATLEAQTLTDRFRTAIGKTGAVRLVERRMMEQVLEEQGFQQTGCTTDECAVEVGKLLGVQQMVGGSIGKVGNTFTIDARMISVETGESIRTKSITYVGKVDGLIIEIEVLAYKMMEMQPPKSLLEKRKLGTEALMLPSSRPRTKTRMGAMLRSMAVPGLGQFYGGKKLFGFGFMLSELTVVGLFYTTFTAYQNATDDYNQFIELYRTEEDVDMIAEYRSKVLDSRENIKTNKEQMEQLAMVAGGIWAVNVLHALLIKPENDTANKESPIRLVYDPVRKRGMLTWTVEVSR